MIMVRIRKSCKHRHVSCTPGFFSADASFHWSTFLSPLCQRCQPAGVPLMSFNKFKNIPSRPRNNHRSSSNKRSQNNEAMQRKTWVIPPLNLISTFWSGQEIHCIGNHTVTNCNAFHKYIPAKCQYCWMVGEKTLCYLLPFKQQTSKLILPAAQSFTLEWLH